MKTKFKSKKSILFATAFAIVAMFTACEREPDTILNLRDTTISVPGEASYRSISFEFNQRWGASVNVNWITLNPRQGGGNNSSGFDYTTMSIQANPTLEERTAIVTITSGELRRSVTLTQAAIPALSISPEFEHVENDAETHIITVTSSIAWTVEVANIGECVGWYTVYPTSGVGSGTINVTLTKNQNTSRRSLIITLSASDLQAVYTLIQDGEIAHDPQAITINGTTWASRNVNNFGWFTTHPEDVGAYFQFNRPMAYFDNLAGAITPQFPTEEINENSDWTLLNDPCPTGWRVPTAVELGNLANSGFRWVSTPIAGAWFGPDAQTASFETPDRAVFLPAGGRISIDGIVHDVGIQGNYWTSNQQIVGGRSNFGRYLYFRNNDFRPPHGQFFAKRVGLSVRCVRK